MIATAADHDLWPEDTTDGRCGPRHRAKLTPAPTAPIGTLLEMVQLARYRHTMQTVGGTRNGKEQPATVCRRLAETHASMLLAAPATEQQRAFVRGCPNPWGALLTWCEAALAAHGARLPQEVA